MSWTWKSSYEEIHPFRNSFPKNILRWVLSGGTLLILALLFLSPFHGQNSGHQILLKATPSAPSKTERVSSREGLIVDVSSGSVLGRRNTSRSGRNYFLFLGIPYASPPLGELRFKAPVEVEPWSGTLSAVEFKADCIQKDKYNVVFRIKGSEDCLYLNVFTPNIESTRRPSSSLFPVLVHIHGGGQFGSATKYRADYFMDEDVVLVAIDYRLGILGNLNVWESDGRGNQGAKDQVKALQWIQTNIHKFGGDAQKVALFGNSGGGMHVSTHLLSPLSKGLFQRAICQSGVELTPGVFTKDPLLSASKLGEKLNCSGDWNSGKDLLTCFKETPAEVLIRESFDMDFAASVEPRFDSQGFLVDTPLHLLQNGNLNPVPVIFGVSASEGLHFSLPVLTSENLTQAYNVDWSTMAGKGLWLDNAPSLKDPGRIADDAREFYLGNHSLSRALEPNFTAMFSDRRVIHPTHVFASHQVKANPASDGVYLFYFNEPVEVSYADKMLGAYGATNSLGPAHGDELQMLFPYDPFPYIPLGSENANLSKMMVRIWVSFANDGKPMLEGNSGTVWTPIRNQGSKHHKWLELKKEPRMTGVLRGRMEFWDSLNPIDLYV